MNRRRFLQALGVIAAAPAVVAKLAHHERHPAAPPAPRPNTVRAYDPYNGIEFAEETRWAPSAVPFQQVAFFNDDMLEDSVAPYLAPRSRQMAANLAAHLEQDIDQAAALVRRAAGIT